MPDSSLPAHSLTDHSSADRSSADRPTSSPDRAAHPSQMPALSRTGPKADAAVQRLSLRKASRAFSLRAASQHSNRSSGPLQRVPEPEASAPRPDRTSMSTVQPAFPRSRTAPKVTPEVPGKRRSLREVSRAISLSVRQVGSNRTNRCSEPLQCSLSEVSPTYLSRSPKFYSAPYDIELSHSASHALALVHNAAQKELVSLVTHVVPACSRASRGEGEVDAEGRASAIRALSQWWAGFSKFSDFVAKTEQYVVETMFRKICKDEHLMFDNKERRTAERQRKKILERTSFTMELVFRAVEETIAEGVREAAPRRFVRVVQTMNIVVNFLLETYDMANAFVRSAEARVRKSRVFGVMSQVVRILGKCDEAPMLTVMLVRWMDDAEAVNDWACKYLRRRARRNLKLWEQAYDDERGAALETIVKVTS